MALIKLSRDKVRDAALDELSRYYSLRSAEHETAYRKAKAPRYRGFGLYAIRSDAAAQEIADWEVPKIKYGLVIERLKRLEHMASIVPKNSLVTLTDRDIEDLGL